MGGGLGGAWGGGHSGRVAWGGGLGAANIGGGIQVGRFGVLKGGAQALLTSPYHPSNHTITINLTLIFATS